MRYTKTEELLRDALAEAGIAPALKKVRNIQFAATEAGGKARGQILTESTVD
jgi:hypothetical protein